MIPESRMWRTIRAGARQAAAWPFRVAAARVTLKALANMDRRELADIGLNPSDVRDASALPLDRDPTELLARRARERRRDAFGPPSPPKVGRWPLRIQTAKTSVIGHVRYAQCPAAFERDTR